VEQVARHVPAFNLTLWQLRASLRMLRKCGYTAHRTREILVLADGSEEVRHDNNDSWVLVERTDGISESEILEDWKR